jgi:hypothetical protein
MFWSLNEQDTCIVEHCGTPLAGGTGGSAVSFEDNVAIALRSVLALREAHPFSVEFSQNKIGVQPGRVEKSLRIDKVSGLEIRVLWGDSTCNGGLAFALYEGEIGNWGTHVPRDCEIDGAEREATIEPGLGNRYYLVVPVGGGSEGSYGVTSEGVERAASEFACRPVQELGCY